MYIYTIYMYTHTHTHIASLMAQWVKNLPAMQETQKVWGRSLGVRKIPWGRKMATHCSILAWKIHRQRTLEGYSPMGHKESDMIEWLSMHTHTHTCVCVCVCVCVYTYIYVVKVKIAPSCPTLCNRMDYTVHGILQARTGKLSPWYQSSNSLDYFLFLLYIISKYFWSNILIS